jgi:8-oxo-dGTP pyrophosphatase MutT (NUDIX family)
MIRAAGFLFFCNNQVLLLQRTEDKTWANVGGLTNSPHEASMAAATRETIEELGSIPPHQIFDVVIFYDALNQFTYITFLAIISEQNKNKWNFQIDTENLKAKWFYINQLPKNLHFGLKHIMKRKPQHFTLNNGKYR